MVLWRYDTCRRVTFRLQVHVTGLNLKLLLGMPDAGITKSLYIKVKKYFLTKFSQPSISLARPDQREMMLQTGAGRTAR